MHITPKTAARLEAQTGKFLLSEYPPERMSYVKMSRAVGALLTYDGGEGDREMLRTLNPVADDDDFDLLPMRYSAFLREQDTGMRDEIRQIAEYIARYESLAPLLDCSPHDHIDSGNSSHAYRLKIGTDDYVVRKVHAVHRLAEVDAHLRAAVRVRGIPHLEHIVAASYARGETVAPYVPGVDIWKLDDDAIDAMTQQQFDEFYTCLEAANARGVGFDGIGDNILYDKEIGFSAIDLACIGRFHGDADKALYENFTDEADQAVYRGKSMTKAHLRTIPKMCRLLAATLAAKDDPGHEALINRLYERAQDIEARIAAPSTAQD